MSLLKFAIHAITCSCYIQLLPQYTNTVTHKNISESKNNEKNVLYSRFYPAFGCRVLAVRCSMLAVHNTYVTRTTNHSVHWSLHYGSWMACQMAFCSIQTFAVYSTYRTFIISIFFVRALYVFHFIWFHAKYARHKILL